MFPALVIGAKSVDKINYRYLVADKRYLSTAFRNVRIVDYDGKIFDVEKVQQDGGVDLFYSVKLVGYIVKVKPILQKPVEEIDLNNLKAMLIKIVKENPRQFSALLDSPILIREIESKTSISQIIDIW